MTPLDQWLRADHREIEALLAAAQADGRFHPDPFQAFRQRLLRHIAIEEKVVFPAVVAARGGEPMAEAGRMRVEHHAITQLLIPTPDLALVAEIDWLLARHDQWEEGQGGVYDACDAALGPDGWQPLLARAEAYPPVRVVKHHDGRLSVRTAAAALERAGRNRT